MMHYLDLMSWIPFFFFVLFSLNLVKNKWKTNKAIKKKLPAGPWKLPIIGNMHQLIGSLPHHALKNLAQKHGDLMHLQLGEISAIVASSPRMAKAILKTHDVAFADRPDFLVGKIIFYDNSDIAFSPFGDYWRQMRKIATLELLSNKSVRSFSSIRKDEILQLISSIREEALKPSKKPINLAQKTFSYTNSMVCRVAFGRVFGQHRDKVIKLMKEVLLRASGFDISDILPSWKILCHLSLMKPKLEELHDEFDEILETIIQKHLENPTGRNGEFGQEDLIDVLLRIQKSGDLQFPINNTNIKAVLLDMFTGGTTTSATVVEWAMAEMMRNPDVMAKAQREIRKALPRAEKRVIEEIDIQKLSYLKLVIKETLRLHSPVPLLVPRDCKEQCEIDGYIIPPKTRVMVNVWAIGRDPKYWNDPESFQPERFENNTIDILGTDFEYLPFGGGKRICPGISFGLANVEVPLANLLYHFNWKLPDNIESSGLDMAEAYGLAGTRKNSLLLIPSPLALEEINENQRGYESRDQQWSMNLKLLITYSFNLNVQEMLQVWRWDISVLEQLPGYIRPCYRALLNVYFETAKRLARQEKANLAEYAISSMQDLAKSYCEETKWILRKDIPNYDEYMKVALPSCGYKMLPMNALMCMGKFVTQDILDWMAKTPLIITAVTLICRLMDDIANGEWGKQRGEEASAVECHMHQYNTSREDTLIELRKQVANAWKD
ncbi:OLC1v1020191C1 [Oldenlandia corymbosa var. corymbosa]|uniref:OLC1v1020191C1 n=1 Tax=Oldenlandia corymbosa var. corymbosa TaxID=529605 RepID=A0AAV1EFZ6_OLDCO|nr:OLC1v1020191C1 [Oldenlandia corymbosa var. corymbosa]